MSKITFIALSMITVSIGAGEATAKTGNPGKRGTVTAYDADRVSVIDSRRCSKRKRSYRYTTCGKLLRARVNSALCRREGAGDHVWYYRVGSGKRIKQTARCGGSSKGSSASGKASVTAYYPTRTSFLDSEKCYQIDGAIRYSTCGSRLRSRVKRRLCKRLGKGSHSYYYRRGNGDKSRMSIYCKR